MKISYTTFLYSSVVAVSVAAADVWVPFVTPTHRLRQTGAGIVTKPTACCLSTNLQRRTSRIGSATLFLSKTLLVRAGSTDH